MKYRTNKEIRGLFKTLNVDYLTNYNWNILKKIDNRDFYNSDYYYDNKDEFDYLADTYGNLIRNKFLNSVYISESPNKGLGLFADNNIKKDDFIGVYFGQINEIEEFVEYDENGFDTDYAWDFPDEIDGFPLMEINAKYSGNELRFANHSEEPNLRVEHTIIDNMWYIFFVADSDINKDNELTISYGENYWATEYRELSD